MRIDGERRKLVCLLARDRIAMARHADEARRRGREPNTAWIAEMTGEALGIGRALQALSPGRHGHYRALAARIARRFGVRT